MGPIWVPHFHPNHSGGMPAVVELYSEWCGPCKSVIPTFKKIRMDQEDETTLQFLTVGLSRNKLGYFKGFFHCMVS